MDHKAEIGIVIPFYNGDAVIRRCLDSITASRCGRVRVFIVDNSSEPTSINETALDFAQVHVIRTTPSIGFGKACNIGAAAAAKDGVRILVCLNQDTVLAPDCLQKLAAALDADPSIGIAVPINWSIEFQTIEHFFVRVYLSQCPELVADAIRGQLKSSYSLESAMGSCIAIPAHIYQVFGLFDEIYFMYYEDVDLCRRYRRAGLAITLLPSAYVGHINSQTSSPGSLRIQRQMRNSFQQFQLKGASGSFLKHSIGLLREALFEQIRAITRGQFGLLVSNVCDDLNLLLQLPKIYSARERERVLIEKRRVKP